MLSLFHSRSAVVTEPLLGGNHFILLTHLTCINSWEIGLIMPIS